MKAGVKKSNAVVFISTFVTVLGSYQFGSSLSGAMSLPYLVCFLKSDVDVLNQTVVF